jgi:hypothetical protein
MGHQDAFLRPRLSARYRLSQGTLAGTRGNGRGAPIPDLPTTALWQEIADIPDCEMIDQIKSEEDLWRSLRRLSAEAVVGPSPGV